MSVLKETKPMDGSASQTIFSITPLPNVGRVKIKKKCNDYNRKKENNKFILCSGENKILFFSVTLVVELKGKNCYK